MNGVTGIGGPVTRLLIPKGEVALHRITMFILCLFLVATTGAVAVAEENDWAAPSVYQGQTPALVFATFYEYGLQVFDVSDPAAPENVGEFITPRKQALDVMVDGDYAYVADGHGGLQIYDVTNLKKIKLATSFKRPSNARAVDVEGGYAYLAAADSMQIFDVSDPANAYWITTYEEDIKFDQDLDVVGDYAYVACGVEGLKIYDVSVPLDTHKVGHVIPSGMARSVVVSGQYAYIGGGSGGLQIIDISYPDDPQITGGIRTSDLADGIFVDGNIVYVTDRYDGLHIIDVSDPFNPVELSKLKVKGKASGVFVMGDYAFVAAISGDISIVDISDPADPALVKWLRWHGTARSVYVIE